MALILPSQYPGFEQCLFKLIGADGNVTTDQSFVPIGGAPINNYQISRIRCVINAASTTTNITTAAGGIYNAISKPAGGIIVAAAQAYTALDALTKGLDLTIAALGLGPQSTTPYFSLTTGQGAATKLDLYIYGYILTGL